MLSIYIEHPPPPPHTATFSRDVLNKITFYTKETPININKSQRITLVPYKMNCYLNVSGTVQRCACIYQTGSVGCYRCGNIKCVYFLCFTLLLQISLCHKAYLVAVVNPLYYYQIDKRLFQGVETSFHPITPIQESGLHCREPPSQYPQCSLLKHQLKYPSAVG